MNDDEQPDEPERNEAETPDSDEVFGEEPPVGNEPGADERDEPLGELAERARQRQAEADDEELMGAFESVETGEVDEEQLWEQLESEGSGVASPGPPGTDVGSVDEATGTSTGHRGRSGDDREVEEVDKRQYCGRCQYFSAPPEVRCTHEDGEIIEVIGTDGFRVRGCPILRGEEELQQLGK